MISSPSSSSCEVGSLCAISAIVGLAVDGPMWPCMMCFHVSSAAWAALCRERCAVSFSLSSKVSTKAAEAVWIKLSRHATEGCSDNSPAMVASRFMSRIRGLAAIKAPRCAGRATSTDLSHPIPDWLSLSVACCALSSVNSGKSLSSPTTKVLAVASSVRIV